MTVDGWSFAASIGDERKANLEAAGSFGAVVDEIQANMEIICCHDDPCSDHRGFSRAVYCVTVPPATFDRFFNSRHGYRAAYFRSPHEGLAANSFLLRSLLPSLLGSQATAGCGKSPATIEQSLASESAKAWLAESGNQLCDLCVGEWKHPATDPVEISNGRWENTDSPNARRGRTAPYLTMIKFFGAFLNDRHDEFIPARKRRRAWDIHEWGWS
jgi:hypothetical protein